MAVADQLTEDGIGLDSVAKRFGTHEAVRGVSLFIRSGETLVLLGPSGCGKTTLLRLLSGLETPDRGRIVFGSRDMTHVPVRRRGVGMVFQSYALFPHMTVKENVAYGLRAARQPAAEVRRRVDEVLGLVALSEETDRYPAKLSGGQQQRVAIARALAVEPAVMLLDEPFGALDVKLRKRMQFELRGLLQRLSVTSVHVTHDQDEALTLADRIAVMRDGALEQVGTPREVYERPVNAFVASFLGDANLLPLETDGALELAGIRIPGDTEGHDRLACVRPEHIQLVPAEEDGATGRVVSAVFLGETVLYEVRVANVDLRVKGPTSRAFAVGADVSVKLPRSVVTVEK